MRPLVLARLGPLIVVAVLAGAAAYAIVTSRDRAARDRWARACEKHAVDVCLPIAEECDRKADGDDRQMKACLEGRIGALELMGKLGPSKAPSNEVAPVYPRKVSAIPSSIEKLCDALHGLPKRREAECCGRTPGVILTSECTRNLAGAATSSAVEIRDEDAGACAAAMESAHAGCDWVGPTPPPIPSACLGIIRGKLGTGDVCRSTLECSEGLRCLGSGPTDTGRCGASSPIGSLCNTAVDPLVVYTRQDDLDVRRPPCAGGFCDRNRCRPRLETKASCRANAHCAKGRCAEGTCVDEPIAPIGGPCLGGDCPEGARCSNGRCIEPNALGSPCASDAECKAACVGGTCKMGCETAPMLKILSPPMKRRK